MLVRYGRLALAALLPVLILSSCGGGDEDEEPTRRRCRVSGDADAGAVDCTCKLDGFEDGNADECPAPASEDDGVCCYGGIYYNIEVPFCECKQYNPSVATCLEILKQGPCKDLCQEQKSCSGLF